MKIRDLKRKIYSKLRQLIFWRKIIFVVKKVKRTPSREVIAVADNELVSHPDWEMWAVYKTGEAQPRSLHFTKEEAQAIAQVLNEDLRNKIKSPKLK